MAQKLASPGVEAKDDINRICAGETDSDEFGNEFEVCPENPHGHLYFHGWCLHCHCEEPE